MKKQSFLVKFLSWILGLAFTAVIGVAGVYVYAKMQYDIDLFATIKQVRTLAQPVDEAQLIPNKFSNDDMQSAMVEINASIPNFVKKDAEDHYDISGEGVTVTNLQQNMILLDKECGAVVNLFVQKNAENNFIKIGSIELPFEFVEMDFAELDSVQKSVKYTAVYKLDARNIKAKMSSFPLNFVKNYMPDYFYVSATTTITKTENSFEYSISDSKLKINNLNQEDTMTLMQTLNKILKFGEPEEFARQFVEPIVHALIGNAENSGLSYSIKQNFHASDFEFVLVDDIVCFEIYA